MSLSLTSPLWICTSFIFCRLVGKLTAFCFVNLRSSTSVHLPGLVELCGPKDLCPCVGEDRGDGEGVVSEVTSNTLRYINLTEVVLGLTDWLRCVDRYTCVHVWVRSVGTGWVRVRKHHQIHLLDTVRHINLADVCWLVYFHLNIKGRQPRVKSVTLQLWWVEKPKPIKLLDR